MRQTTRCALAVTTFAALLNLTNGGHAQEVVSSYVTFYGFDDNDDGNPAHLGTGIISSTPPSDLPVKTGPACNDGTGG